MKLSLFLTGLIISKAINPELFTTFSPSEITSIVIIALLFVWMDLFKDKS